jgi:translation initiation factor 2 alpha subunit (eIF-2alpha)
MQELEEGQIVLCTVTKILGTIVFVKLDEYNLEGTITFSEISPGRIRNIRDYVNIGRKIVCKVLRINPQAVHLSLRRVKLREKKELNELIKKEKSYKALFKTVLGKEESEKAVEKIKQIEPLAEFLEKAKEDSKLLEKQIPKQDSDKILKILKDKKQKETILKTNISLTSKDSKGIILVKDLLNQAFKDCKNCTITYTAAGMYQIKIKTPNPKQSDTELKQSLEKLEKLAKQNNCKFLEKAKVK